MLTYLFKRILLFFPVLFAVATLVFFLLRLIPGDPVDFILGENALQTERQALVSQQHFDDPLPQQYFYFLTQLAQGRLGKSYFSSQSVEQLIWQRYPATLFLAGTAILWALVFAIPLGVFCSIKKGKFIDRVMAVFSVMGISIPTFYLGPLLVLLFAIKLDWLPVSGRDLPGSFVLPSLTLCLAKAALLTRMTRASMIEVLSRDYLRTARAKGLSGGIVLIKHCLRTALLPVVAILALQLGTLLAGAVITEKVFSWPGIGSFMLEAISKRDYAVAQGCIMVIAITYVLVNLLADLLYTKLDPRIELK